MHSWNRVGVGSKRFFFTLALLASAGLLLSGCGYVGAGIAVAISSGSGGGGGAVNAAPIVTVDPPVRATGNITVTYTLTDVNGNDASITIEHAAVPDLVTDPLPTAWQACTAAGGDGVTDLSTSKDGEPHTFIWDAPTDLGFGPGSNAAFVRMRITPQDANNPNLIGNTQETANFIVGNDPPTATVVTPASVPPQAGLVQIDYTLFDSTDDPVSIVVEFSTDGGTAWSAGTVPVGETSNLTASVAGEPHNFVWDSITDGVGNSDVVRVRITPADALTTPGQEVPVATGDFTVENNTSPIAFIASPVTGQILAGDADISYLLLDLNLDPIDVTVEYSTDGGLGWATATEQPGPPSEGTVGLSSSPAGDSHLFRWDTLTDIPGEDLPSATTSDTVSVRVTPQDPFAGGTSSTMAGLRLNNNLEPSVTVTTPPSPQILGDVVIDYTLFDNDSNDTDIDVQYSLDGGQSWTVTTESTNPVSEGTVGLGSSPSGTVHTFVWDTGTDLAGAREGNVVVRIIPTDNPDLELGRGAAAWTDVFVVDNTVPPSVSITAVPSPSSGVVLVDYTLTDIESDPIAVDVSFSTSGLAGPFAPATRDPSQGEGVTGLASSPAGVPHVFAWDSLADLGPARETTVALRIIPSDTKTGASADSNVFEVNNNDAPIVVVDTPVGVQSGNIIITYTLLDTNSDPISILVEWSTDGGTTYDPLPATECTACTSPASDGISGLSSSPGGTGHIFIWESISDIGLITTSTARIRITPSDSVTGASGESGTFDIDNGSLVPIVLLDPIPRAYAPNVFVQYRLLDGNSSPADVAVEFTTDGVTFNPVTSIVSTDEGTISGNVVSGQSTSSGGIIHNIVWDTSAEPPALLPAGAVPDVQVRITPSDIDGTGVRDTSNPFIKGNDAPSVTITSPIGGTEGGVIPCDYTLYDSTSDPLDLVAVYSTDGGGTFASATIRVGGVTNLSSSPGGVAHSMAWNSLVDVGVGNFTGVIFRITPSDDEPLQGPPDSVTFDVQNNDLPIAFIGAPVQGDVRSADVNVSYILIDGNSDPIVITVEVSTNGGANFATATLANTDEGLITLNQISGLSSSPGGTTHLFDWVSGTDFPAFDSDQVQVRITPDDPQNTGVAFTTQNFLLNNNVEPQVKSIDPFPPGNRTGNVSVTYTLEDTESDTTTVAVSYSIDGGGTFNPATLANPDMGSITGNEISGLTTSPAGIGHSFEWVSTTDLPGARETSAVLLIEPSDHTNPLLGLGVGAQTAVFVLDNTSPPEVRNLTNAGTSGTITLDYGLYDAEPAAGPTVDLDIEYSTDGITFFPATVLTSDEGTILGNRVIGQTPSTAPAGAAHWFQWDSLADIGPTNLTGVTVRVVPSDTKVGLPADTVFDVLNNDLPEVLIQDITGVQSGDVNVSYALRDSFSDTLSITVEYRLGAGGYVSATESTDPLSEGTGPLTSGPQGQEAGHLFIWDSLADISTTVQSAVEIRITASDPFGTGAPTVSNVFTVDNAIDANLVLGKDTFNESGVNSRGVQNWVLGMDYDGSNLYITDRINHRVLILNAIPTSNYQTADLVLGQADFTTNVSPFPVTASGFYHPWGVYSDGTKLYVADSLNSRVLIWDPIPTVNNAPADHVLGPTSMTVRAPATTQSRLNRPRGVYGNSSQLFVADSRNHRVLVWNLPIDFSGGEGPPANYVLGQANFTANQANRGGSASAVTLNYPEGVHATDTTLYVADSFNNRVLLWNLPITANEQAANEALGQPTLNDSGWNTGGRTMARMGGPYGVWVDSSNTYVADRGNHRVLIWNSTFPATDSSASTVLGQLNGTQGTENNGGISATSLGSPMAVLSTGSKLLVSEGTNCRVKIHNSIPVANNAAAQVVFGQKDFASGLPNHAEVSARFVRAPGGIHSDGNRLLIADTENMRILGWSSLPNVNNKNADLVLGQPTFTDYAQATTTTGLRRPADVSYDPLANGGAGRIFVADTQNNRVVVYDGPFTVGMAGSAFIGQPDATTRTGATAQNRINGPQGVSWDGAYLWVSERLNNRVTRFSPPFATSMNANLLLAQTLYTDSGTDHSGSDPAPINGDQSLDRPYGLVCTGTELLVADQSNSRVLVWTPVPTTNDEPAAFVLGQPDFGTTPAGTARDRVRYPLGVESDGVGVYVSDASNHRILIWDSMPSVSGTPADRIIGQPDFTSNVPNYEGVTARSLFVAIPFSGTERVTSPAIVVSGGTRLLWAPDQKNDRVLRYDVTP